MNSKKSKYLLSLAMLVIGLFAGWLLFSSEEPQHDHTKVSEEQIWTCSMHPQIRQNEPGDCPICGMDLIPLASGSETSNDSLISMTESAMQLAQIATVAVHYASPENAISLSGKVQWDESKMKTISAHLPGRIESLEVNFEGQEVARGEQLASIYSPELIVAAKELKIAQSVREEQPELYDATLAKLRSWKLNDQQIDDLLDGNNTLAEVPLFAEFGGIVVKKYAQQGEYVGKGQPILDLANLENLWVNLELHENELSQIRKGTKVDFSIRSLPGKKFSGKIDFIDPQVDRQSRVAIARMNVTNDDGILKPEMIINATVAPSGVHDSTLVIPKSAVMWTGNRSIVYILVQTQQGPAFDMQEVTLGRTFDHDYEVVSGVEVGDEVVSQGTFVVDAAAQLAGKPSMMNRTGAMPVHGSMASNQPIDFSGFSIKDSIALDILNAYVDIKDALSQDDEVEAHKKITILREKLNSVPHSAMGENSHRTWVRFTEKSDHTLEKMEAEDLESVRLSFISLSEDFISLAKSSHPHMTLYVQFCPMANDNAGAYWLSRDEEILNPYFGESMLKCGKTTDTIK